MPQIFDIEQAVLLQPANRLAHRHPADAHPLRDVGLVDPLTRGDLVVEQGPAQLVVDALLQGALIGQRLEVLYLKRRAGDTVFVCSGGVSGQITVPRAWTDRGEPAGEHRLSMAGLAALVAVTRTLGVVDRDG